MTIRVFVDGKAASASSSDLKEATLTKLVDGAIARARLGSADRFAGLPEREPLTVEPAELGLFDPAISELATEKLIGRARELEAVGRGDRRINKSLGATVATREGSRILVNSQGFAGSFRRGGIFCNVGSRLAKGRTSSRVLNDVAPTDLGAREKAKTAEHRG